MRKSDFWWRRKKYCHHYTSLAMVSIWIRLETEVLAYAADTEARRFASSVVKEFMVVSAVGRLWLLSNSAVALSDIVWSMPVGSSRPVPAGGIQFCGELPITSIQFCGEVPVVAGGIQFWGAVPVVSGACGELPGRSIQFCGEVTGVGGGIQNCGETTAMSIQFCGEVTEVSIWVPAEFDVEGGSFAVPAACTTPALGKYCAKLLSGGEFCRLAGGLEVRLTDSSPPICVILDIDNSKVMRTEAVDETRKRNLRASAGTVSIVRSVGWYLDGESVPRLRSVGAPLRHSGWSRRPAKTPAQSKCGDSVQTVREAATKTVCSQMQLKHKTGCISDFSDSFDVKG
jgi:hypothetical protein